MATTITLPLIPTGIYNFTVNWGDGTSDVITSFTSTSKTHTYLITGGTKTIYINGTISGWTFNNTGDKTKINSVTQWGNLRLGNSGGYFYGCSNLKLTGVTDTLNLSGTTNLSNMFRSCTGLTTVNNMNSWDVSNVTDMYFMFYGATSFNQPIGNWNVSKVTNMRSMFSNTPFNQPIGNWDVSNVTDMSSMFNGATNFNQPIGNWNVSGVTNMYIMFYGATNFNQPIGNWNVSNVTHVNGMYGMFASTLNFNQPLSGWNVSNVTNMGYMFQSATSFNQPIGNWNVSKVTNMTQIFDNTPFNQPLSGWNLNSLINMNQMFYGAKNFNQDISNWNVSGVTNMQGMFRDAKDFNNGGSPNINNWNVSKVNNMTAMFLQASSFNQPIGNWNVSNVISTSYMFLSATTFNQDLGNWNVSGVTNMTNMLSNTSLSVNNYNSLLTGWTGWINGVPTKSVKSNVPFSVGTTQYSGNTVEQARNYLINTKTWTITDGGLFVTTDVFVTTWLLSTPTTITLPLESTGTYNFTVNWGDGTSDLVTSYSSTGKTHSYSSSGTKTVYINGTINGWSFNNGGDKTKIRSVKQWGNLKLGNNGNYFYGCTYLNLNTVTDTLNLSGTTNLINMFNSCYSLTTVNNINSWDVSKVTDITGMFDSTSFNQSLSNWDVSSVTGMSSTFYSSNFNQPIGNWNVSGVTSMSNMFGTSPFNQPLSGWNVSNVTDMNGMFNAASSFNQPISNWNVGNVIDMSYMFANSQFNQPISNWNVGNVIDMSYMFANSQFNQPIGNWNVSKVINMDSMFESNINFNQPIGNWNVSGVTSMGSMFAGTSNFNQPLSGWNVSNVTYMSYMLAYASIFNQDISNWNVSNVNDMTAFMEGKTSLDYNYQYYDNLLNSWSQLPLQNSVLLEMGTINYSLSGIIPKQNIIDNYNWTINDGGPIFSSTTNTFVSTWNTTYGDGNPQVTLPLTSTGTYNFVSYWGDGTYDIITSYNQSEVTHTYSVGGTKTIFIEGLIDGWSFNYTGDYEKITSITQWGDLKLGNNGDYFNGCFNLNLENVTDILNLSGTTNLNYMFMECISLTTVNNINSWDVSNVITMEGMFFLATNFNQPLSGWNVSNVTNMNNMFYEAYYFNQPIGNWNVSNVTGMNGMFANASSFNQDISNWNVSGVTNMSYMLAGTSLSRTNYNSLLTGWTGWINGVPTKSVQSNVPFSVGTTQYTCGSPVQDVINYLTTGKTWTITNGGCVEQFISTWFIPFE